MLVARNRLKASEVRVDKAAHEMTFAPRFDVIVVNDTLEHACAEAYDLVQRFLG